MIDAVVFDLDDTLYEEKAAKVAGECAVATSVAEREGWTVPDALARFLAAKRAVLRRRDLGPARNERWRWVAELIGDEAEAHRLADLYWTAMLERIEPYVDAAITLPLLAERAALWIATNEHAAVQERKLARLGLTQHFSGVISADAVGHDKPAREFFAAVVDRVGSSAIFVGDNPVTDIVGRARPGSAPRTSAGA